MKRKKKISLIRRISVIWYFVLLGCPTLVLLAYKMGFRLEGVKP